MSGSNQRRATERTFGIFFGTLSLIAGLYAAWGHAWWWAFVFGGFAMGLLLAAFRMPGLLAPLNQAWHGLGMVLARVVNPLVLGLLFFGLITPVALLTRALGRDPLRLRPRRVASHWIERESAEQTPESFRHQF